SLSLIDKNVYLEISPTNVSGRHNFVLEKNYSKVISPSKSLRKFPLNLNFNTGTNQETKEQKATGILINGVEISNYKGSDKIYYGPLGVPTIYNTGNNYDVANPPVLEVESPQISTGTTAHIQPILSGSVTDVLLNQVNVPIKSVSSISISGGNGGGAVLEPVIENKYREVEFNAKTGINFSSESIIFSNFHNFYNGEPVVYSNNGNASLGIGTYLGSNQDQEKTLLNGGVYYAKYVTPYAINLYETVNDFNSGINTVGFTTVNTNGIHKFRSLSYEKVLTDIKVINGGFYENRKLIVKPAEISLSNSSIVFKNHGFSDGELVIYTNTQNENLAPLPISGLTTNNQYYIIKISDDEFRLANAGIGATISNNYIRKNYAKLTSIGSGYHIFNYPEIKVDINVSYANTTGIISAIPVVRGSINDLYVYEKGSDYGSDILNLHKIPSITTKNGKNAVVRPIVTNGKITEVVVDSVGSEYYSLPDLIVSGKGSGAKLKANINDGKLTSITVIKTGIGYASTDTFIEIKPSGTGFKCDLNVRKLTINNQYRFGGEQFSPINDSEVTYQISGYEDFIRNSFSDNYGVENTPNHSPIIGWAFDGNPIYGPFGYSDPDDQLSIKLLLSSYKISQSEVENRPNFPIGMFIEDYVFDNSGDLDEHNGRYTKTPDFPNGVYAYFATIKPNLNITNTYEPSFPYFIGNSFKSKLLPEIDDLTQDFDFINSNLLRNTFPYVIGKKYSSNDYIEFSYNDVTESSSIDGVTYGNISSFEILNSGDNYKVGDSLVFDNSLTSGYGVSAEVSEVVGKNISSIETQITSYNDCIVTKFDENNVEIFVDEIHTFDTGDYVTVTGISSYIKNLDGQHQIKVDTFTSTVLQEIPSNNISGIVTDIYVSNVPSYVSSGSSIGIGTELLSVLNVFGDRKVLRVKRGVCGSAHTQSTEIEFKPNSFKVPIQIDF
ncbi:MAG: YHYH protein, partial [Flavobacteriaceae bacterium]|nr:YHYH protein [Flavobacteriaceae bacterium]